MGCSENIPDKFVPNGYASLPNIALYNGPVSVGFTIKKYRKVNITYFLWEID